MGFKRSWVQIPPARVFAHDRCRFDYDYEQEHEHDWNGCAGDCDECRDAVASAPMLSAGIVGLPNVGKSTLFNAVTRSRKAAAANYPFCTIDPNLGVVSVPDPRLEVLAKLSHSQKVIPAAIEFVDLAGLGKGAR